MSASKKKSFVVGLDFDDVIFNFNPTFYAYHNVKYGSRIERQHMTSFDMQKVLNCTLDEVRDRVFEFTLSPEHGDALPVEGAKEALAELSKKYELHIITARNRQANDVTFQWIEKHFPKHFQSVTITNQFFGLPGTTYTKVEIGKKIGIDVMIEDSIKNAHEIGTAHIPVILLDTPWNQGELPANVTRVYSWAEIVDAIHKKAAELS